MAGARQGRGWGPPRLNAAPAWLAQESRSRKKRRRREPPYSFGGNSRIPSLHWHKKGVGRACESLCKRQRRGAEGGGRLRLVLTRYPSRQGDAGLFGGVCSRRHARLSYEQQWRRRQHMAGVRQHPEALQRRGRGRGRAGDRRSPRRLWGPGAGTPKARGPLLPFLSSIRTVDRDGHLASRQCLAQRGCKMGTSCGRGQEAGGPSKPP